MPSPEDEEGRESVPQPASRLRRALDIARRASAPADTDGAPTLPDAPPALPDAQEAQPEPTSPVDEPEAGAADRPKGLRSIDTVLTAGDVKVVRQRRNGRGLDALLPGDPSETIDRENSWEAAAQGWVQTAGGDLEWRPIVATTDALDRWEIGTYLGIVTGQAIADSSRPDARLLARARREALDRMLDDALARGGHGVVGVTQEFTPLESGYLVSIAGTAVTLGHRH